MTRKSSFEIMSTRVEECLSGLDKAQTTREISESLGLATSTVHGVLQLMEVFGTVQKAKRGSYHYFLKGDYTDEQISAILPPEKVKSKSRYATARRRSGPPVQRSFLEEHLSAMRVQAGSGEGPSALAMIGLTQQEIVKEEMLTEELPRELEVDLEVEERVDLEVEERQTETPRRIEPFATVDKLPKDARRLNLVQTRYLKEQLRGLGGYGRIEGLTTAFAEFSALENGSYGNVFYFSVGTNPWERVCRVTVDDPFSLETVKPVEKPIKRPRRRYRSKYNRMIDRFMECGHDLVEIDVKGKKPSYVASRLRMRIEERELDIVVSSVGGFVYLENKEAEG